MDSNDNSSKENCIPPNVENQETGNAPVSKGSPGGTKRPAAGSRSRPPIPQKPPVAKKPNLTTGSHCVSKSASTCTVPNSTSSPPTETLHTHSSSSVPPVKTSADKKANKQSVNNNRAECNNTSDVVSVKDRTKTLGLYAAGKSLFYIDQKFVHAPAPQTNPPSASAHSTGKDNACTHTPVSEPPARTRSAKLRLPLIGFKRNSKPSSSVKAKRSEWYTEFEPDFGDVSVVKEDVHPATASRVDKSRVDESGKTRVQGSATADVEAKPNASLLSNTFTESANKTGPPKSPKPATRKSVQPKSTTTSPSPQKVRPQPVPRKRRNVMSTISTDGLNSSVPESVMESKNSPANSMSAKDSVNAGKDNDSKIQPNEYVPQIIENDLKPDHCSALSKVDDSDAAVTNGTAEKTDHLEDSECGEVVCCETTADVSPNNGNTFQTPSGASTDVQQTLLLTVLTVK
ncbi:mucin-5AC-like [Gigantopelta aegis]|uniref:mucin-5AC-like n=1 Tax=Gigantopelta aegis TaxID=1735272 RepID=UPI001B88936B|nr:mucin-5AC-like [Gigantopelta aegis]